MAYLTFSEAVLQARRKARLTGKPFSSRDVQNLGASYMAGAPERTGEKRAAELGERSFAEQKKNFAESLAQQKELSGLTLEQQKELEEKRELQAKEISGLTREQQERLSGLSIQAQRDISAGSIQNAIDINNLQIGANKEIYELGKIEREAAVSAQTEAANRASQNQLYGSIGSTGAILGGAYLMSGSTATGASLLPIGSVGLGVGGGGVVGGVVGGAGGAYLGRQTLGGGKQQTGSIVGGVAGGIVGGAVLGAAATSWTGPGAIVGGAIGGIVGGVGAAFGWW